MEQFTEEPKKRTHRPSNASGLTAPGLDGPPHPQSLMPGRVPRHSISTADLYFTNRISVAHDILNQPIASPPPVPLYPAYMAKHLHSPPPPPPPRPPRPQSASSTVPHHPSLFFQRQITSPVPPLPPKIPIDTRPGQSHTLPDYGPLVTSPSVVSLDSASLRSDPQPNKSPSTQRKLLLNEGDLAEAIAMSHVVSKEEEKRREQMSSQEEKDLAKALEASLLDVRSLDSVQAHLNDISASSSTHVWPSIGDVSVLPASPPASPNEGLLESTATLVTLPVQQNEHQTPTETSVASVVGGPLLSSDLSTSSLRTPDSRISEDEAYARRLAQEDESSVVNGREGPSTTPPIYSAQMANSDRGRSLASTEVTISDNALTTRRDNSLPIRNTSDPVVSTASGSSIGPTYSTDGNLPSYDDTISSTSDISHTPTAFDLTWNPLNRPDARSETILPPSAHNISHIPSSHLISERLESEAHPNPESGSQPGLINLNSFVDKELFFGVSIGFTAPKISSQLVAMPGVMPNIISLPYGRCTPLHIQGPSWKHILKLMAKLSGTRLEPTLDAVAISKQDLKLRTVVQFIKPHHSSPDWRIILYFTIDYPSPRPGYVQDVNELPYSYYLSSVPTLLRDASDTPISKTFTIPASESVPYPTLPITFPSLATYLQAALEDSRRYLNDSSSGNRRLARLIETCFRPEDLEASSERQSVGGLFKKVIGRNRNNKVTKPQRGGNEDTYELVTPFVQDEWG